MPSRVAAIPAAPSSKAAEHYAAKLAFETDCWDVHESLASGAGDFVLLDVRGRSAFAKAHVPDGVNLPHVEITEERMRAWPRSTLFVVYCAGPHCNGADRAAHKLALLERPVKIMIGGMTGWADERFSFASEGEVAA